MITYILNENVQLILSSEAEFPDFGPPKAAVEGMLGERGKQYCTETLSRYSRVIFQQTTNQFNWSGRNWQSYWEHSTFQVKPLIKSARPTSPLLKSLFSQFFFLLSRSLPHLHLETRLTIRSLFLHQTKTWGWRPSSPWSRENMRKFCSR